MTNNNQILSDNLSNTNSLFKHFYNNEADIAEIQLLIDPSLVEIKRLFSSRPEVKNDLETLLLASLEKLEKLEIENELKLQIIDGFKIQIYNLMGIKSNNKTRKRSIPEKILVLEYLGVLKGLSQLGLSQKEISRIISELISEDITNTTRSIRYIDHTKEKGLSATKTIKTLNSTYEYFIELNLTEQASKVKLELDELKKG